MAKLVLFVAIATTILLSCQPVSGQQCPSGCTCTESQKRVTCSVTTGPSTFPVLPTWTQILVITGVTPNNGLITAITKNNLQNYGNLTEITLRQLGISSLATDTFHQLTKLKRIDLGYNDLKTLPSGVFDNLSNMQYLDLSHNQLDTISNRELAMPHLSVLSLKGNSIKLNDSTLFQSLKNLQVLDLSDNYIGDPIPNYQGEFRGLRRASLRNCSIKTLSNGLVTFIKKVERLELNDNEITDLPVDFAPNLASIKELHLDNNLITKLRNSSFDGVQAFTVTMSNNRISDIEPDAFKSFTTEALWLHNNKLSNLPPRLFQPLGADLKKLYLNDNPLQRLNDETFYGLTGLSRLRLRNAQIQDISPNAFRQAGGKQLDLSGNNLTTISNETVKTLGNFSEVDLTGNKWNCTEPLIPLRSWLIANNQSQNCDDAAATNCLRCSSPDKFVGRLVVNLTENELITALDPETTTPEPTTEEPTTQLITTEEPTTPEPTTPERTTAKPTTSPVDTRSTLRPVIGAEGPDIMLYVYVAAGIAGILLILVLTCLVIKTCHHSREVTYPLARKELENGYIPETGEKADDSAVTLQQIFTIDGHTNPGFKMNDEDIELGVSTTSLSTYNTFRPGRGEPCRDSGIVGDSPGSNQSINKPIQAWEARTLGYENRTYSNLDEYT